MKPVTITPPRTDEYFKDKISARMRLTTRGFTQLPTQTKKTHFLPMMDIEYWKQGYVTAGIREIQRQGVNRKWLVFYRDNTPDKPA